MYKIYIIYIIYLHIYIYMFSLEEFFFVCFFALVFKCNVWEVPAKRNQKKKATEKNRCRIFYIYIFCKRNFCEIYIKICLVAFWLLLLILLFCVFAKCLFCLWVFVHLLRAFYLSFVSGCV